MFLGIKGYYRVHYYAMESLACRPGRTDDNKGLGIFFSWVFENFGTARFRTEKVSINIHNPEHGLKYLNFR